MGVPESALPAWLSTVRYDGASIPAAPLVEGGTANCQRFAYAVLSLVGRHVPPLRSSDLWESSMFTHPAPADLEAWDLVLVNGSDEAFGAHVAVVTGPDRLLHLCAEIGTPASWTWADFAARDRYRTVVGGVRVPFSGP